MPLTEQQAQLAATIDTHVTHVLAHGGEDEALLMPLADHMGTFKQLMDLSTGEELNALCERYKGFYRVAAHLERLAEGIAHSRIPAPAGISVSR